MLPTIGIAVPQSKAGMFPGASQTTMPSFSDWCNHSVYGRGNSSAIHETLCSMRAKPLFHLLLHRNNRSVLQLQPQHGPNTDSNDGTSAGFDGFLWNVHKRMDECSSVILPLLYRKNKYDNLEKKKKWQSKNIWNISCKQLPSFTPVITC